MEDIIKVKELKKVIFVINNLSEGGAERILVNILNNIDRTRIMPTLFVFEKYGNYLKDLNNDIPVKYAFDPKEYPTTKYAKAKRLFLRATKGVSILSKEIEDQDLVVAFLEKGVTYFTYEACRRKNKPCIAWLHNNLQDSFNLFHKKATQYVYKRIDRIVTVSQECETIARKEFSGLDGKIKTIYNPIDLDKIYNKSELSPEYELPSGINILAIGRLTHQKGFDVLIKAFSQISPQHNDLNLIILGEGDKRKELETLISQNALEGKVYLPGFIGNPYPILKQADIFVLSSHYEGLPTVVIEALTLNKTIVATKCSGVAEILDYGNYGNLVEINDVDSLANGIEASLTNSVAFNAEKQVSNFDKRNVMNKIEEMLLNI